MSLDHESLDFVPSIFSYTKQNQNPDAKIKRYQRKKKWSERLLVAPPNQPAPAPGTPEDVTSMDHSPTEEDIPVTRTEYNDLNLRYTELKSDYVNLQEKYQQLRDENERLKEELKKSTFSYSNIKCNMVQLLFITGITSVLFDFVHQNCRKCKNIQQEALSTGSSFDSVNEIKVAAHGATLRIPAFTKGKRQLSAQEVDTSRQLSRVRIHVERVIGRWKNFRILQTRIPLSQADLLDDIVIVCASLTNLSKSVVLKKSKK
ncbi:uncharacterized protein LOC133444661 isoform X2 [Cololabis saira]|uniref:uncharacterized protein LOC133444661 isoform X2 n=1 Tax=Cololabis saira TaxID=129043 RepID=UPI002AD23E1E|nr:uncharacterized protein LOC133444661 isoform X2 [Cololabis saira]